MNGHDDNVDLVELLKYINPSALSYQEWINVGFALKLEGYSVAVWDAWSRRDTGRYHERECEKKWESFNGSDSPVTAGTIVQMAKDNGWRWTPPNNSDDYSLDWDSEIGTKKDGVIIDAAWVETRELSMPESWNPVEQITKYLETLFEASETVGYVTESWEKDGRYLPTKGSYTRTSGELIEALSKCNGDIGAVLGDYKPEAGAWIRFNPLDGKGVKNDNVTDYRYALVESDTMDIDQQNTIIRELELPVACLVFSGKKSLHAIVRIEAANYEEYRKRVDYLYNICQKNGMTIDRQNKNPSRLSRMPGVMRNGNKQCLIDTNIGKSSWTEWYEWVEGVNDDLPELESMADTWNNLPALSEPLIDGILRQGHKMLLAGPSKAGKSFSLIELCCAIAEGMKWLGFQCTQGKVLYVNLELDRASCLHRFRDVYEALGYPTNNLKNIDIWNLRGKTIPMDKLAPKLIRRAAKKNYIAVIIDPIYKVITGDENSADQMAHFCNQFDKVCTELGCAVIYCHHHSKGAQGGKRSMDRASGSGVFARDPDALLDLIELDVTDALLKQRKNTAAAAVYVKWLERFRMLDEVSQDDMCGEKAMSEACKRLLKPASLTLAEQEVDAVKAEIEKHTAWRIDGTLREYPKFSPVNMWFEYPVHRVDVTDALKDIKEDDGYNSKGANWKKNFGAKKTPEERKKERKDAVEMAYGVCSIDGDVTVEALAEYMGTSEKTARNRLKEHGGFRVEDGNIERLGKGK